MAILARLYLEFQDKEGGSVSMIYPCVNKDIAELNIKELMQGIIRNGSIFEKVPVVMKSAKLVTTSTSFFNI